MATVVLMQTEARYESGTDQYRVFDIVDGQQRITTLIVILKAIAKRLLADVDVAQHRFGQDLHDLLVKRDNQRLILLQTNHESANDFRRYLLEGFVPAVGELTTSGQRNLVSAFRECEAFVQEWGEGAKDLLVLMKNRLTFVNYVLTDQGSAYTIFEVLNSRGLPVDAIDKCKSMLMAILYENLPQDAAREFQDQVHGLWTSLYGVIGVDDVSSSEILRFSATLLAGEVQSRVLTDEDALSALRERCLQNPHCIIDIVNFFVELAKRLKRLRENRAIRVVCKNRQSRLLFVSVLQSEYLDGEQKRRAFEACEKLTFLVYGIYRRQARYEVGEMIRLAWRIVNERMSADAITEAVTEIGIRYMDSQSPIANQLMDEDCYSQWDEEARYFFFKYEEFLAAQAGRDLQPDVWERIWNESAANTLEHIMPQNLRAASWAGRFGTEEDAKAFRHRLGNLMLLPPEHNRRAQDHSFEVKREIYRECTYLRSVASVAALDDWTPEALEAREMGLAHWAEEYWNYRRQV